MANNVLVGSVTNSAANTIQNVYDAPANGTIITAWTATNNTGSNRTYKAYIYDLTGSLLQAIIPLKIIIRNRFDLGSGITNQFIPGGGSIRVESDLANSIVFRISGNEL